MPQATVFQAHVFEDGGAILMARVVGNAAAAITQASLAGITYSVHDLTADAAVVTSTALTVSAVVFDTLQTDALWTKDATGYNFKHAIGPSAFPTGKRKYAVEYLFDPASGNDFWVVFHLDAIAIQRT